MNRLPIYKLTLLTAVDKGMIDPEELQGFMDDVFGQGIISIKSEHFKGLIYAVKVDETETILMSDNGEVELMVLREEEGMDAQDIIALQIALWNKQKENRRLEKELEEKKAFIESGIISFDRRLNDARNLIECYENMANKIEKNRDATLTIFENIEPFLSDADALYTIVTQIVHIWENTTTDPTAYDPIPF